MSGWSQHRDSFVLRATVHRSFCWVTWGSWDDIEGWELSYLHNYDDDLRSGGIGGTKLSTPGWGGQVAFKYAFLMTALSACKVRRSASHQSKVPAKAVVAAVIAVVVAGAPHSQTDVQCAASRVASVALIL